MDEIQYQTYVPQSSLASLVKCYWTLEIPSSLKSEKQRIIPDGCLEMAFILGDDIKRYINDKEFILQPRAMVLGQTIDPFYIEPTGHVNTFAVRFFPFGFSHFVSLPIHELANKETPLEALFDPTIATTLATEIGVAESTSQRIEIIETFLLSLLQNKSTIDTILRRTTELLFETRGSRSLSRILKDESSKKRQIERKFQRSIGVSPKQLGRIIRIQAALKMMLNDPTESLSLIAYENDFYDQAHFIKDFKYFTGTRPKDFFADEGMVLSTIFFQHE